MTEKSDSPRLPLNIYIRLVTFQSTFFQTIYLDWSKFLLPPNILLWMV